MSKYWIHELEYAEKCYLAETEKLKKDPDNPWSKSRADWLKTRITECREHVEKEGGHNA